MTATLINFEVCWDVTSCELVDNWCNKRMCNMVPKTLENYIQYFLHLVLYSLCAFLGIVIVLRVLLSSYVYLLYSYVYLLYCVYCCSYFRCRTAG
jgi:hypothetical protein